MKSRCDFTRLAQLKLNVTRPPLNSNINHSMSLFINLYELFMEIRKINSQKHRNFFNQRENVSKEKRNNKKRPEVLKL